MSVALILAAKGRDVVTVAPGETLETVAALIAGRRIGAVVVTGPSRDLLGIISERDIVRALVARGGAALADLVSDHMTREVVTGSAEETVNAVMERMTQGRFRHLPILKDGRLDGIVSIGDVVKHRLAEIESEATAMRAYIASA
jgi:CBS domain-containing protein